MHVVATAGHVDHGKSTLVRALTGMEPDRWAEERRRGMTLDLGFAWADVDGQSVAFVDVPGHERFVTTMLAGVGSVPAVLLVVAADEGWMPQSAEHADALAALGVTRGLLVVTRADLAHPAPARDQALAHLHGTSLARLPAVAVCAVTGEGMDGLRRAIAALAVTLPTPAADADVRLWVDRAFTIRGAGTVVTGTLPAGTLRVGDGLELATAAGRRTVTVRGLQSLGEPVAQARGVARVAVNLRGVAKDDLARGDVLLTPDVWLLTDVVDVRLADVRPGAPSGHGTSRSSGAGTGYGAALPGGSEPATGPGERAAPTEHLTLHIGSAAVTARVRSLGPDTARLRLGQPVPLRIGDRAVLRDPGRHQVVAGVTVLDVAPPPLRRRGDAARRAGELAGLGGEPDAVAEVTRRGVVRRSDLLAMGVPAAAVDAVGWGAGSRVGTAAGWLVDPGFAQAAGARLAAAVAAHDAADPVDPGLPREAARRAAGLPDTRLVDTVLPGTGLVLRDGRVSRPQQPLPADLRRALDALRADLATNPFAAPDAARLAELRLDARRLAALVRAGQLMRIAEGIVLLPGADDRAVRILSGLDPEFTLSQARQALGTTRRVAVPLLEMLGRTGRTIRTPSGGHRLVAARRTAPSGTPAR